MEMSKKDYEAKKKEAEELQSNFDALRTRYNQGVELMKTSQYQAAMSEFEAAAGGDPGKHAAFSELTYRANANLAEAHYQIGVDLFNQKKHGVPRAPLRPRQAAFREGTRGGQQSHRGRHIEHGAGCPD